VPPALLPCVNSMLAELAGVGAIGLVIQLLLAFLKPLAEKMSVACFGEEDTMLETFEFIHLRIFEVAALFFVLMGRLLAMFLSHEHKLTKAIIKADADGDGKVTPEEFQAAFGATSLTAITSLSWVDEMRAANAGDPVDAYLFRRRFKMSQEMLPEEWGLEATGDYAEAAAAETLDELVELSPTTWLFILPLLAVSQYVKIKRGAVGADTEGLAAGAYFSDPIVLYGCIIALSIGLGWGVYNFAKLVAIKKIIRPVVRPMADNPNLLEVAEPLLYQREAMENWMKTNRELLYITDLLSHSTGYKGGTHHDHHRLFGAAGHHGPHLFLQSIKLHTWLLVLACIYSIEWVVGDIAHLTKFGYADATPGVVPELIFFSVASIVSIAMLHSLTPATFTIYNLVTVVEGCTQKDVVEKVHARRSGAIAAEQAGQIAWE